MQIKLKSLLFGLSLFVNALFIFLIILSSFSKYSRLSYYPPDEGLVTAATVINFPKDSNAVFENFELTLKPGQYAYLQYSVILSDNKQSNMLINAIYDPDVITVFHSGFGIEILALSEGSTLMQTLTNDGVKNIASINVVK
jgi:hypothetical protein